MDVVAHRKLTGARAVVIGAGIAGLSAAIALASRGARVLVVEESPVPGGRLARIRLGDYRFDLGESAITQPALLGNLFTLADLRISDFLEFQAVDPFARLVLPGGQKLNLWRDRERLLDEVREISGSDADRLAKHWRPWESTAFAAEDAFFARPGQGRAGLRDLAALPSAWPFGLSLLDPRGLGRALGGAERGGPLESIFAYMASRFGACLSFAPASLKYLLMLELSKGLAVPVGGMSALVDALVRVARMRKVRFALDARVERIELDGRRVATVLGQGFKPVRVDFVVSTLSPHQTLSRLLPDGESTTRARKLIGRRRPGRSAVQFFYGCPQQWDAGDVFETAVIPAGLADADLQIDKWQVAAAEPILTIQNLTRIDPDSAGEGRSALRLSAPAPPLTSRFRWNETSTSVIRADVLARAEAAGFDKIEEVAEEELVLTPESLEQSYGLAGGAIYGSAVRGPLALLGRPGQVCPPIPGLLFAGAAAHPGPTASLASLSGMLAAEAAGRRV